MSPMMPYGSSGGKGGSMGGFGMDTQGTGLADYSGGGGKGGSTNGGFAPDVGPAQELPPPAMPTSGPTPPAAGGPAAPVDNAFTQGVGAQDKAMDFFSGAMGGNNDFIMNMIKDMASGGNNKIVASMGGGGGQMVMPELEGIARDVYDYDPTNVQASGYTAAQLADANLDPYMNPYTQDVIDTTMADLGRARDSAMNATGLAATRGGAFGGDRHAIMESQNNADYMRQAASTSANLRNQGFQNAQNAAMADINSLNQQRSFDAQAQQAASMANAQAANERAQFVGSTAAQAEAQKQQLEAQMAMRGGGGGGSNSVAIAQANAQLKAQQQQNALQAAMQMYGMQYDAANQLYNMGGDRYDMGQEATANLAGVGNQVDQINQGLINQIQQQFMTQQNAPQAQYQQMLAAMSGMPNFGGTQTYNPGFFDYASLGAGLGGAYLSGPMGGK